MLEKDFVSISQEMWDRNYRVFYNGIDRGDGCWEWNRYIMEDGYGVFGWMWKSGKGGCSTELAHRVSWILHNKKNIPDRMYACHTCDNPSCVNPNHLFIGTQADNMRDMVLKGHGYNHYGENAPSSKLRLSDVIEIRSSSCGTRELSKRFGVSETIIRDIKYWRIWTKPEISLLDENRKNRVSVDKKNKRSEEYRVQKYLKKLNSGHWHWGDYSSADIRVCISGKTEAVKRFLYKKFIDSNLGDSIKLTRVCNDAVCVNPSHYKIWQR